MMHRMLDVPPSQLQGANVVAFQADYGNVARDWRVLFGASYWQSRFRQAVVQAFADSLFVTGGSAFKVVNHLGVKGAVRADLLSGLRSTQARAGASYYFSHPRGTRTPGP